MTGAERQQRYIDRLIRDMPAARDTRIDALKARVAELESELTRERAKAKPAKHDGRAHQTAQLTGSHRRETGETKLREGSGPNAQISKLIRHLGNANEAEAAAAARKLVSKLAESESDRHALAELWEKHCEEQARQRPPKPKPVDWPEVERAIKTYAEGKTKVNLNRLGKALYAQVPALKGVEQDPYGFFIRCLRGLGFVRRGEMTYERP
jgi:hypothetical protein